MAKLKLKDLGSVPNASIELEHPALGNTGIFVTMASPYSKTHRDALQTLIDGDGSDEQNLMYFASCIEAWDEESFDGPCTIENKLEFLKADENQWAVRFLTNKFKDLSTFFRTNG